MTKKDFIRAMQQIQNFHSQQETLKVLIKKLTYSNTSVKMGDQLVNTILDLLNEILGIEDKDLLSWWLFEDVDKKIWIDGNEVGVPSMEELYEYIVGGEKR